MKTLLLYVLVFFTLSLSGIVTNGFAQSPNDKNDYTDKVEQSKEPLRVEVEKQAGNPLQLTVYNVDNSAESYQLVNYLVQNLGQKTIRAFVISRGPNDASTTFPNSFLPGRTVQSETSISRQEINENGKILLRVDFVLFQDGTSWGKDSQGMSEQVYGFYDGQADALKKAHELYDGKDDDAINEWLQTDPNEKSPPGALHKENPQWRRGYILGYRWLVNRIKPDYDRDGKNEFILHLKEIEETGR